MKSTASLSVILVAAILALGDGAYLRPDNRGQWIPFSLLNCWLKISGKDFPSLQATSRTRYIDTLWCSLCFLAETEMDAIERVLNQAETSSSKNFWYYHSQQKYSHLQLINWCIFFLFDNFFSAHFIRWVFGRTQGPTYAHTCKKRAGTQAQCP